MRKIAAVVFSIYFIAVVVIAAWAMGQRDDARARCAALSAEIDSLLGTKVVVVRGTRYTFVDAVDSNLTFDSWGEARRYARERRLAWRRCCCCPCCR